MDKTWDFDLRLAVKGIYSTIYDIYQPCKEYRWFWFEWLKNDSFISTV
jgi:hypothetical protein